MRAHIISIWHLARACVLIYACLYLGIGIAALLPIALPGSILGMLILFALLSSQIIPADWVKPGCHLLIHHMAMLFVPIGVGVMQYFDLLRAQFDTVVISCTASTLIVLITVSWCSHILHKQNVIRRRLKRNDHFRKNNHPKKNKGVNHVA
ncbi:CidA/LrgA family protein [Sodalis sp. RH22]|uniref:CidA/LrgA family protein n=1 Tax=unclassified Sodalis (in: enterobacteria) TaxID=2636512 RepID=UPI0039B50B18